MADWETEQRRKWQARINDKLSGQGSLSREIEASLRGEAARTLHDVAAVTGSESMRDAARRQEEIARLRLSRSTLPQSTEDVEGISDVPGYIAHLAIQSAPTILQFMGGAAAGGRMALRRGLSKTAGRAAGGVAGVYPSSTGGILSAQDEQAGQYDLPSAAALGAGSAAVSVVGGPELFIARGAIPRVALQSRAGRTAALGVGTSASEGGEEFVQQGFEEIGRAVVDPTHDVLGEEASERYRESTIGGAALGLAIGGAAGAISGRPADRVARGTPQEVPITETPAAPDTQPRDLLREYFGSTPQRQPDQTRQEIALARGQGELFRPSEMTPLEQRQGTLESFGVPPAAPAQTQEPAPAPGTTPEQGDMLAGTSVELAAEIGSEMTRTQVALEQDFSQEALVRELRVPNKNRADSFVTQLANNLSRALRGDPEQAVELLNDLANRPNSITRNNVLRRAAEIVQDFESRKSQFDADAGAARQLLEEQVSRERTVERASQARQESRPGARVTLPEEGSATEQQIRERNRQQALEDELPEASRRGEESIRRQSTVERRRLLKDILDDPETQNPTARFIRALRKAGYRRGVTEEESRVIRRFEEVRDAFRDVEEPAGANELTPEVTGIPERTESQAAQPARQRTGSARSRYAPENFELTPPPSTDADFDALDRAAARRARRRGEADPASTPETGDRRQLELFTPTGKPTRVAQGLPPQRRSPRRMVEPAFEVTRESTPTPEPTPAPAAEPTPEPAQTPAQPEARNRNIEVIRDVAKSRGRAERSIERALDNTVIDFEQGQQLYQLLDDGRVDEVNRRLAQAHREASGQTRAAPTSTSEATRRAEAQARDVGQRDQTVRRADEDPEDEGGGGPGELRFSERANGGFVLNENAAIRAGAKIIGSGPSRMAVFDEILTDPEPRELRQYMRKIGRFKGPNADFDLLRFIRDDQGRLLFQDAAAGTHYSMGVRQPELDGWVGRDGTVYVRRMFVENTYWFEQYKARLRELTGKEPQLLTQQEFDELISDSDDRLRMSESDTPNATPTTLESLSDLRELFGNPDRFDEVVSIHATEQDAISSGAATEEDFIGRVTQGFAKDGKVHLIAENIPQGQELAVFLHEVGGHLGLKKMIGNRNYLWVRQQIEKWANRNDDSVEARVGRWVRQRTENMSPGIKHDEIVAYAIEGLVNEGVTPQTDGAAGNMFRRIWAAVKRALRTLGFKDPDRFTGQHLVDLAFGAADLELRGQYHGTAADPRVFDDRFIGTGEGNAMFGWGHYLADQFLTGDIYRKTDSVRKFGRQDRGNLLRAVTTVRDDELLRWDEPLSKQPEPVKNVLQNMPELRMLFGRNPDPSGEEIYTFLDHMIGTGVIRPSGIEEGIDPQKAASQFLDRAGIKGNKYLDQGSRSHGSGTYNYVIFNGRNITRVHSRRGGDPTRMRFSEASNITIESARNEAEKFGVSLRTTLDDYAKKGVQMMTFGRDLRDVFDKALPSFRRFFDTLTEKQAVMLNMGAEINNIMNAAQPITGEKRTALNSFLMRSTKSQAWGFKPDWAPDAEVDPEMQREFSKLSPEAKEVARRVFRHGHETLQRKNAVVQQLFKDALKEVDEENISDAEKKKLKARIMRQNNLYDSTFRGMKGPYAPLERFGNYVTVAKSAEYRQTEQAVENGDKGARARLDELKQDADHYAVFFSDTMGDAEVKRRELQASNKFDHVDRFEKEAFYKTIQEAPWTALLRLKNMVSELAVDSDREKQLGYINSLLRDLYLASLSEASARKHDLKRQNIEGADPDMMRAFAAKGKADAHFIAALMSNGKIIKAMNDMRSEAAADSSPGGVSKADRRRALNEALHRHAQGFEWDQSPIGGLQDKAMALTSFWFLATSPRYYIQNLLQVPMVSLPTMAGRFGMAQSWGQLQRAYNDLRAGFGSFRAGLRGNYDIDALRVAPDEKAMLERLRDTGLLDVGMQFDMGYWESTADTGVSSKVAKVNHAFRTIARQVEVINRVSTALAAYRLQRQRTPGRIDPETAMDNGAYRLADSMVSQTHGDYSYLNKPRLLQSIPRLFTQFRTYQLIQLSLVARYAHSAFKGEDAETRAIGRRTLAYILGQHAVVTGMLGLPAVQAVAYVMALAFGPDDEPADGERFLRRAIGDDTYANFLLKGVPAGMGLDVSRYIGMGESTSLLPFTDVDLSSREGYAETAVGLLGPFVSGVAPGVIDGMNQMRNGDYYKGLEATMPSGIRAGMRALRLATEGQSNRRGDQLLSPEEISAFDIAAQALNFETTKLQELRRKRSDLFSYENYYRSRSSELKSRYTRAFKDNDRDEMRELREEWRNLQVARRRTGFKVQPLSSLTRAPAEQRKRERNTRQGLQFNAGSRRAVEMMTE